MDLSEEPWSFTRELVDDATDHSRENLVKGVKAEITPLISGGLNAAEVEERQDLRQLNAAGMLVGVVLTNLKDKRIAANLLGYGIKICQNKGIIPDAQQIASNAEKIAGSLSWPDSSNPTSDLVVLRQGLEFNFPRK